jgi:hypothetical protein
LRLIPFPFTPLTLFFPEDSHSQSNYGTGCSNPKGYKVPRKTLAITPFFPNYGHLETGPRCLGTLPRGGFFYLSFILPPNITTLPPLADSCDLPVHDLAIMLPPNIAALSLVADTCNLPVRDPTIMLPPNIAALPPVVDSCDLPVHDLAIVLSPTIAALVEGSNESPVYDSVPINLPIQFDHS